MAVDKIPSSNAPPGPILHIATRSTPEANDSPKQKVPVQSICISSPRSDAKDVEASAMARFQILNCRGDNINTSNVEEKCLPDVLQADATDSGSLCKSFGRQSGRKSFDVAVGSRVRHHNDHIVRKL